ncbi:4-hydroxy-2-oxoglutarate aldolase, mitochondrial [Anaerolineaceae bacterium]|nr:4-hydroxy-2-oxoglutarate aldolase, mitochondrial [Anaerolineaceae bacterium]
MNAMPLDGYVIQGSNGEYVYLSIAERVAAIEAARAVTPAGRLLIAGSGMEGTAETIALTRQMAAAGADIAIVVSPCYYKGLHDLRCARAPLSNGGRRPRPIPVMLYNVPGFTGVDMGAEVAIRCAAHANFAASKTQCKCAEDRADCGGDAGRDFSVLTGSGGAFLGALAVGASGTVAALANVAAAPLAEMQRLFHAGKLEAAAQTAAQLDSVNMLLTARLALPA